ncbi:hypothetical protein ASC97_04170 [Rhizobium sp. Root1203]|uniref:hypothetical protein n=1 Tax=Rhizobium sp. Root1203 TaxID=1736427 RepID=UPI00070DEA40|nr:hypothetical protein [Rhizobium sp. Root1203]KQV27582.1 hypothetical protein ASC97_04170 [Rhizobium sp. Root1203]
MLNVDRFGLAPVVTKQQLVAMAPHVRSECLALMREAGLSEEAIGRKLRVRASVVRRIADARHLFRLPKVVLAGEVDDEIEAGPKTIKKHDGLPRGSFMILKFAVQRNFEFSLSKDALARELNAEPKVIDTGMTRLVDEGFILRIRAGVGGKPPIYRLTERGEQLAATVFNLTSAGA